ncbi:MAG: hypothetical protein EP348_03940 [Alphaproteobacteria bacterium]|nr:MAG: hypothetical protein EP348_03940 [Alphaproteobacteria bacterium]
MFLSYCHFQGVFQPLSWPFPRERRTLIFELVITVDWSAAAKPGPARPRADRCWIAWSAGGSLPAPEYFRTRTACRERIIELLLSHPDPAFVGFDFPFGYPAGSGMGGGRQAAEKIEKLLYSDEKDANNRFEAAALLNADISPHPGPFWGVPPAKESAQLTVKKPSFAHEHFAEWRIAEKYLRDKKYKIMNVWQLLGQASVGSQTLTGLRELAILARHPALAPRVKFWPFETGWDADLDGIILTEIWPSLTDYSKFPHLIKDAQQMMGARDWILRKMKAGRLRAAFAAPHWLTASEKRAAEMEEGWILGVR